jgi:7,8-dihydroneopterin aldolase/epimerase/oxygenase
MNQEKLPAHDYLCSRLKRLELEVHVGLHPWELHPERPTRLWVDVELYSLDPPRRPAALYDVIDYDRVRNHLRSWESRPHTPLLETLAEELVEFALADERVDAVRVRLQKPDIFNEAESAGVELFRRRVKPELHLPAEPAVKKKPAAAKKAAAKKGKK